MNKQKILYVTDDFLDDFKTNFGTKYINLYKNADKEKIKCLFSKKENVIESNITFDYKPLILESDDPNCTIENIKILWNSLKDLKPTQAGYEKIWVALENTYYLDYHLDIISSIEKEKIKSRTIFDSGKKRSLVVNNLSLLWWLAYYTYDEENEDDPFHHTEFFVSEPYRGDAVAYFSSNLVSSKNIVMGTLDAIRELIETKQIKRNRYAFANSNKLLNQIGGIIILDYLSRDEIKKMVMDNLLDYS